MKTDFRPPGLDIWEYSLLVRGSTGEPARVELEGVDDLPAEFAVAIVDPESGQSYDLKELRGLVLPRRPTADGVRYTLLVGEEALVMRRTDASPRPRAFELQQNYPNPFNAGTVIPFDLKRESDWMLVVYNVAGQRIRNLRGRDAAGRLRVSWDGLDEHGRSAASGVYFYRLTAGNFTATRKMILVR